MNSAKQDKATAAVAIIEVDKPQTSFLVLRRTSHPNDPWSGHFSFPGGRMEKGDTDLLETCIRETFEETGIQLRRAQMRTSLSLEPAGRNFNTPIWVQPFLFTLESRPSLDLEEKEIQSSVWLSATKFQDASLHGEKEMLPGKSFPVFAINDYYLWGFTYRLLSKVIPPIPALQVTDT